MKKLDHIAYNHLPGKTPTVVFLSGFKSDMGGSKAVFLEGVCEELGLAFLRFDYFGHGQSEGKFEDGTISQWKSDTLKVIDELTTGEIILIGSSMGGWIMLLAALARPTRIKAIIGIASAPDFTEELIWRQLSEKQKAEIEKTGKTMIPDCYGNEPYPITKKLLEDGRGHLLLTPPSRGSQNFSEILVGGKSASSSPHPIATLLGSPSRGELAINCPIRLLHGMADEDVPYIYSQKIAEKVASDDVEIHLVKNGTHRMSEKENLQLLKATLLDILNK